MTPRAILQGIQLFLGPMKWADHSGEWCYKVSQQPRAAELALADGVKRESSRRSEHPIRDRHGWLCTVFARKVELIKSGSEVAA